MSTWGSRVNAPQILKRWGGLYYAGAKMPMMTDGVKFLGRKVVICPKGIIVTTCMPDSALLTAGCYRIALREDRQ